MTAVITLTTDFGIRDPYVAEMKAVILRLNPAVHLIDVSHDIDRHDVVEAGLAIEAMASVCGPGTIHVAVVDPGVGTNRRGLAVAAGGQFFVGPDNGLFTPVLSSPGWKAFEVRAAAYRRPTVSATFHGRDVFGPAAAYLARGVAPSRLGPLVRDPVRLGWAVARERRDALEGEVVHVDRFGNLVTSIGAAALEAPRYRGAVSVSIAGRRVPLVRTYGDLAPGTPGALVGSAGRLEVAVREGSAAARLGVGRGTRVRLSRSRSWPASSRRRS